MSFESPDQPNQDLPPDYANTVSEATPYGQDAYATTDIIPPPDENSYSTGTPAEMDHPVRKTLFVQVHHLDGTIITGEHPDGRVREALDSLRARRENWSTAEFAFSRDTSHHSDKHRGLYTRVQERLAYDFGPEIGGTPIIALSEEGTKQYVDSFRNNAALGLYGDNTIIMFSLPWETDYTPSVQNTIKTSVALHEGAHASATEEETAMLVSRPLTDSDKDNPHVSKQERLIGYKISIIYVGGLCEYIPTVNPDKATNRFWEEAFAESYSIRTKGEFGVPVTYDIPSRRQNYDKLLGTRCGLRLTDDGNQTFYNANDNTLNLPWRYAKATGEPHTPGAPHIPLLNNNVYAAGVLDILDSKLPGLFDTIMQSRRDPAAKQYVKDQINSVEPGFYKRMGLPANDAITAENRLIAIIKKFNLADARIGDVL